ncbi:MAG: hypothetical protein VZR06_14590, partial [Butyrivibrio sp.]|nr:hypothetical protein [Butyrivibrio sp.]
MRVENSERSGDWMQIAICDDNKDNLALMEDVIENIRIRDAEVDCFETGESLLDYLNKNPNVF